MSKRLLTGLQPSGSLHLGNYFGALKPFVDLYADYDSHLMVVDYHALTTIKDPAILRQNTIDVVKDYLAAGVDPEKAILFKQSDVPEHTELAWIFECLVSVSFLELAHAYKDKVAKGLEANAGLFNYPMLMAADILLYDTDVVPVGKDQQQHVEYAREAANKFNLAYGDTFVSPQEKILEGVGVVPGTDGTKMSKSYKNTIPLFGTRDEIAKAVMSIVTDSGDSETEIPVYPDRKLYVGSPKNVYSIHKLFKSQDELIDLYETNRGSYKALKEALIEDIETVVAPMREKRDNITDDDVREVLRDGAEKARARAGAKMEEVRKKVGVTI